MRLVRTPASRRMRRWWENVDLVIARPASAITSAQQDSPPRARYRTVARRCWSASAARMRGSWKSPAAGSTTSSVTFKRISQVAPSSKPVVQFESRQTLTIVEHRRQDRGGDNRGTADERHGDRRHGAPGGDRGGDRRGDRGTGRPPAAVADAPGHPDRDV